MTEDRELAKGGTAQKRRGPPEFLHSLEDRIQDHYANLPTSERKVADLILDFPGEIAAYSATELAGLASASKAAVTRLIRRLGYASFEEARRAVRDARKWGSPVYLMSKEAEPGTFATRIQEHIEQDMGTINLTLEALHQDNFEEIVKAIVGAQRVWLAGFRNSHYLAGYARLQFVQVRNDVHLLPAAGETVGEYMAGLRPDDLLIVIGFRRRVPEVGRILDNARMAKIPTLYITDPTARQAVRATWTLRCEVRGNELFDRYTGAMSLLHLLTVSVARETGEAGRRHLKQIETLHEAFDAFD
jgi:DNA-binding MurR/RpiR family transcriptional regulator